jgi:hypothetical protein
MRRSSKETRDRLVRALGAVGGLVYVAVGAALLLAPEWFYATIGTFPPYNRHYEGDVGSFVLPLGIALVAAARSPRPATRWLYGTGAAASALHALNHAYDAMVSAAHPGHWAVDVLPLVLLAVALAVAWALSGDAWALSGEHAVPAPPDPRRARTAGAR